MPGLWPDSGTRVIHPYGKRLLFVCSANLLRSPTAEYVARKRGYLADSCGTSKGRFSDGVVCTKITGELVRWASVIVCMEEEHVRDVKRFRPDAETPVVCWHVPDEYAVYQPELVAIFEKKLTTLIEKMGW